MHSRAPTKQRPSRHGFALFFVLLALGALVVPSAAQSGGASTDGELEDTRGRIDDLDDQLALLSISDVELEARLVDLQADIDAQQVAVADAAAAIVVAEARIAELQAGIGTTQRWVETQQVLLDDRAVAAYVSPNSEGLSLLFESADYNEFHKMNVMVRQIAEHDRGILAALLDAKAQLVAQEAEEAAARAGAAELRDEAEAALADLEDTRAEEVTVRDALLIKINDVHGEIDSLEESEAQLVSIIDERNRAAEAARLAAITTTTTTPPTTSAPLATTPAGSSQTTSPPAPPPPPPPPPPPNPTPNAPSMTWPLSGPVVSYFGPRVHPIYGVVKIHQGIDIDGFTGAPIAAAAGGEVYYAGWLGGYGNAVLIDHGGGYTTLYAHQSVIRVSVGQVVSAGQTVGLVGSTGNSTGPHLHFEVRLWSVPRDPLIYLP